MKILIATTVHSPFDPRVYYKQFISLKKQYADVHILLPRSRSLSALSDDFYTFPVPDGRINRFLTSFYLLRELRQRKADLIIIHDPELLPIFLYFALLSKTPVIYDVHEDYPNYFMQKEYLGRCTQKAVALLYRLLERTAYKFFAGFIFADHFTRDKYFAGKSKTVVIYNYPLLVKRSQLKKEYDLIYPGSLHSGLHVRLLAIADELEKRKKPLRLYIIGKNVSPEIRDDVERARSRLKYIDILFDADLTFKQVQELIGRSKIGLIPLPPTDKYKNNIPTKLFEYLLNGLPQIGTDISSISFFLGNLHCGFCIKEDHYAVDYANKVEFILNDYDHFQKLACAESSVWLAKWNWAVEEKKLFSFVDETMLNWRKSVKTNH